jgi:cytochrome c553
MKTRPVLLGLLATVSAAVPLALTQADDTGAISKRELDAKLIYCGTCHGSQFQGFRAQVPMPRLAGQQPDYVENQLKAFNERRRLNRFMYGVAHALRPELIKVLGEHFQKLHPKPLGGASRSLAIEGEKLYKEGVPSAEVFACANCHGEDAKGNGVMPSLAGQLYDYVENKLKNWDKERGQDPANPDTSAIMEPIAHKLTEQQIKALAAYVSSLE